MRKGCGSLDEKATPAASIFCFFEQIEREKKRRLFSLARSASLCRRERSNSRFLRSW